MEQCKITNLYNLSETIAAALFQGLVYPWEALPEISKFICRLGETLDKNKFEQRDGQVWVAKTAKVAPTAWIRRQRRRLEPARNRLLCQKGPGRRRADHYGRYFFGL